MPLHYAAAIDDMSSETEAAAAHTGLLVGWHSGGVDEGGGRGRPARSRRWRLLSACIGVGAAAALGTLACLAAALGPVACLDAEKNAG